MSWEYIAGFFDGEGSLSQKGNGFRISIPQTNEEVLRSIENFCGFGHVIEVKKRKSHWKDSWIYYITKQEDVLRFVRSISKRVVVKKALIEKSLPTIEEIVDNFEKRHNVLLDRIKEAKKLRKQNLTYRQIGKKLNTDWGYVRRLVLYK